MLSLSRLRAIVPAALRSRRIRQVLAACTAIALPTLAQAQLARMFNTELATRESSVRAVSDDGLTVAGTLEVTAGATKPYRWSTTGGVQVLDGGPFASAIALAMNPSGSVIVGTGYSTASEPWRGFRWTPGSPVDVIAFQSYRTEASRVSADGSVVVGRYLTPGPRWRVFRWTAAGGAVDIGDFGTQSVDMTLAGMSSDGSCIVGCKGSRSFRWTVTGGMQDLGTLGGTGTTATQVSADGSIVFGQSTNSLGWPKPFRWTAAGGMEDLAVGFTTGAVYTASQNGAVAIISAGGQPRRWSASTGTSVPIVEGFQFALNQNGSLLTYARADASGGVVVARMGAIGEIPLMRAAWSNATVSGLSVDAIGGNVVGNITIDGVVSGFRISYAENYLALSSDLTNPAGTPTRPGMSAQVRVDCASNADAATGAALRFRFDATRLRLDGVTVPAGGGLALSGAPVIDNAAGTSEVNLAALGNGAISSGQLLTLQFTVRADAPESCMVLNAVDFNRSSPSVLIGAAGPQTAIANGLAGIPFDFTPPAGEPPAVITLVAQPWLGFGCTAEMPDLRYSVSDECGITHWQQFPGPFQTLPIGMHPVTLWATDLNGNVLQRQALVEVVEDPWSRTPMYVDMDFDGYGYEPYFCSDGPRPISWVGGDCNDMDPLVNPGAPELCTDLGIDNNCNFQMNPDLNEVDPWAADVRIYHRDLDADGYGGMAESITSCAIAPPVGYVADGTDCNDMNPSVRPGASELCGDATVDNDCDGNATEVDANAADKVDYYRDADGDGYTVPGATQRYCPGANAPGWRAAPSALADCNDISVEHFPGAPELCSNAGSDNDCDGNAAEIDADAADKVDYFRDADGDGHSTAQTSRFCMGTNNPGWLSMPSSPVDCNDDPEAAGASAHPGAPELCSNAGTDNDCDGDPTETDAAAADQVDYFRDADADGYSIAATARFCPGSTNAGWRATLSNPMDCNDNSGSVHPNATEVCGNGIDDDCDGQVDEDCGGGAPFTLTLERISGGVTPGSTFVVRASCSTPAVTLGGCQMIVRFDRTRLRLDGVEPVGTSPMGLEISQQIDNNAGTLRYAIGLNDPAVGLSTEADICDMVFTLLAGADLCGISDLVTFTTFGAARTQFTSMTAQAVVPALVDLAGTSLDTTPPVISGGIAHDISLPAGPGNSYGRTLYLPSPVTAVDDCMGVVPVVVTGYPVGGHFPIGTTTVTYTATDAAGNVATVVRTITIFNYQEVEFEVSLDRPVAFAHTRVMRFGAGTSVQLVPIEMRSFSPTQVARGTASVQVPVSSSYGCFALKDPAHSLTDRSQVFYGASYSANFALKQGDSNDDDMVDIIDYGFWLVDISTAANSARPQDARSNFDGNNLVNNGDFSVIASNFFSVGESCTPGAQGPAPRERVTLKELRRAGLGHLAVADLNRDGWVDTNDIQLYMQGGAQPPKPVDPTVQDADERAVDW